MRELVDRVAKKILASGLAGEKGLAVGGLDVDFSWFGDADLFRPLEKLALDIGVGAMVAMTPAEPYRTILDYYSSLDTKKIIPQDSETRTFLHALPFSDKYDPKIAAQTLRKYKGMVVKDMGIIASGSISPAQGYVTASSICFACFVKFFSDYLEACTKETVPSAMRKAFEQAAVSLAPLPKQAPGLISGPFATPEEVQAAMIEAGEWTVRLGLVDSCFGNVSCLHDDILYISQTGSELDQLAGEIDPCPVNGSSCAGLTASSELGAHMEIVKKGGTACVLHGHPRFTVIMSMFCDKDCDLRGQCHTKCREKRELCQVPVVPGEVGTGPTGLINTLPPAVVKTGAAIVFGHGLFATGEKDFSPAFKTLLETERKCMERYMELAG